MRLNHFPSNIRSETFQIVGWSGRLACLKQREVHHSSSSTTETGTTIVAAAVGNTYAELKDEAADLPPSEVRSTEP